jgi:hypothetical protein
MQIGIIIRNGYFEEDHVGIKCSETMVGWLDGLACLEVLYGVSKWCDGKSRVMRCKYER